VANDVKFDCIESFNITYDSSGIPKKRYGECFSPRGLHLFRELVEGTAFGPNSRIFSGRRNFNATTTRSVPIKCLAVHPGGVHTDTALQGLRKLPLSFIIIPVTRLLFSLSKGLSCRCLRLLHLLCDKALLSVLCIVEASLFPIASKDEC